MGSEPPTLRFPRFDVVPDHRAGEADTATVVVQHEKVQLSELQRELCKAFKKRFPSTMAILTVGGVKYEEFHLKPFSAGRPDGEGLVCFERSDTPFFYDVADRKKLEPSLEEEMNPPAPRPLPDLGGLRRLV
jgi:hypothetical protein